MSRLAEAIKNKQVATRSNIIDLQTAILGMPNQLDGEEMVEHHFAPQVYGREMFMKAGDVVVGKLHKHAHMNILLQGKVRVVSEFHKQELTAPHVWVSEPGIKRAIYALEDTRWMTIHPNKDDSRDLNEIEDYVIAPSYEAYAEYQRSN